MTTMTKAPARPAKKPEGPRYWIAVIPKTFVERARAGGFAGFAHGRYQAVIRVHPGDWLVYYSPRTLLKGGDEVRAFTAIGKIAEREPYEAEMRPGTVGWRRDIAYEKGAREAGIYPLLDKLGFIKDREHWGLFFHRSIFSVPRADFALIAAAMGLDPKRL
jgi:EVE domain